MNHPNRNFKFKVVFEGVHGVKSRTIGKFNFFDEAEVFLKAMYAHEPAINGHYMIIMPDGTEYSSVA